MDEAGSPGRRREEAQAINPVWQKRFGQDVFWSPHNQGS